MQCPQCHAQNPIAQRFCGACGAEMVAPAQIPPTPKPNELYLWGWRIPPIIVIPMLFLVCTALTCLTLLSAVLRSTPSERANSLNDPRPTFTSRPASLPTARQTYAVGETISAGNWEYTVTKIEQAKTLVWSKYGGKTDAQGVFLIVYLTLKNVGNQNFTIHTWDFELIDKNGVKYDHSTAAGTYSFNEYKGLRDLGDQFVPGLSANTALIFDVNPAMSKFQLHIEQGNRYVELSSSK